MSDAGGQSRSPTGPEVLRQAVTYFLEDVHTMMPGRVEEYKSDEGKVDVKPLIQRRTLAEDGEELLEELPVIPDVPILFPRTQTAFISLPIKQGDLCMLVFAERSLDNWLAGQGDDTDPDEFRRHDLTDAVAVPGLYPFGRGIKDINEDDIVVGHDESKMQLHVAEDYVEITFNNGSTIKLENNDGGATATIGDGGVSAAIAEHLKTYINGLVGEIADQHNAHVHYFPKYIAPLIPVDLQDCIGPGEVEPDPDTDNMQPVEDMSLSGYDDAITSNKLTFPDN